MRRTLHVFLVLFFIFQVFVDIVGGSYGLSKELSWSKEGDVVVVVSLDWYGRLGPFDLEILYDSSKLNYTGICDLPLKNLSYLYVVPCVLVKDGVIRVSGVYFGDSIPPMMRKWTIVAVNLKVLDSADNNDTLDQLVDQILIRPIEIRDFNSTLIFTSMGIEITSQKSQYNIEWRNGSNGRIIDNNSSNGKLTMTPKPSPTSNLSISSNFDKNMSENESRMIYIKPDDNSGGKMTPLVNNETSLVNVTISPSVYNGKNGNVTDQHSPTVSQTSSEGTPLESRRFLGDSWGTLFSVIVALIFNISYRYMNGRR